MRWLLLKDLQILRRSPLQAVLLVAYPMLIAVLVGFAISRGPEKPRVAFLNEVPADSRVSVGGAAAAGGRGQRPRSAPGSSASTSATASEAVDEVESGDVLAALILPADLVDRINSLSTLTPGTPKVEVLVNEEDPVKAQLVDERISTLLAQANLAIARRIADEGGQLPQPADRRRQASSVLGQAVADPRPARQRPDPRQRWDRRCRRGRCAARCARSPTSPARRATTSTSPGR